MAADAGADGPVLRITYIGHATLLLELGGVTLLTDPNWEPTLGRVLRRVSEPGRTIDQLGRLDAILLTHAHADHLSFKSLDQLPRDIPLYAPPAIARWLKRRGYTHAEPLAPAESAALGGVVVSAAAAEHVGARYSLDRWRAAANMYLIDTKLAACFFAGDTALTPDTHRLVADRIHARGRTLDVALLPIGLPPRWKRAAFRRGHLTPEDSLELFERLGARVYIPYHWGTFNHVTSSAHDAIDALRLQLATHARAASVRILEPGMSYSVGEDGPP